MNRYLPAAGFKPCAVVLSWLLVAFSPGWTTYQAAAQTVAQNGGNIAVQGLRGQAGVNILSQGYPAPIQSLDLRLDVLNLLQIAENARIERTFPAPIQSLDLWPDVPNLLRTVENVRIERTAKVLQLREGPDAARALSGGMPIPEPENPERPDGPIPRLLQGDADASPMKGVSRNIGAVSGEVASVLERMGSIAGSRGETAHGVGVKLHSILTGSLEKKADDGTLQADGLVLHKVSAAPKPGSPQK